MFKAIIGFVQRQRQASEQRKVARERKQKLDKIRAFQKAYAAAGPIMPYEFAYDVIADAALEAMSDEELVAVVAKCEEGQPAVENVQKEMEIRAEADNPNHLHKVVYVAPRNSMWLEYARHSRDIPPLDRDCLVLLKLLLFWGYITDIQFRSAAVVFLGSPTRKFADPNRQSRNYENVNEVMDRPFMDRIQGGAATQPYYGRQKASAWLNDALQEKPRSTRLNRLKRDFQTKGVISA